MIDFGLSFYSLKVEDKAVDLYVLKRAMISLHPGSDFLFDKILDAYQNHYTEKSKLIVEKYQDVELRGRKKVCFG
jgi:tRNA A-37 threonylcarbamoyl transferase component Bud32